MSQAAATSDCSAEPLLVTLYCSPAHLAGACHGALEAGQLAHTLSPVTSQTQQMVLALDAGLVAVVL
jgi:hypothetical protein